MPLFSCLFVVRGLVEVGRGWYNKLLGVGCWWGVEGVGVWLVDVSDFLGWVGAVDNLWINLWITGNGER